MVVLRTVRIVFPTRPQASSQRSAQGTYRASVCLQIESLELARAEAEREAGSARKEAQMAKKMASDAQVNLCYLHMHLSAAKIHPF